MQKELLCLRRMHLSAGRALFRITIGPFHSLTLPLFENNLIISCALWLVCALDQTWRWMTFRCQLIGLWWLTFKSVVEDTLTNEISLAAVSRYWCSNVSQHAFPFRSRICFSWKDSNPKALNKKDETNLGVRINAQHAAVVMLSTGLLFYSYEGADFKKLVVIDTNSSQ